MCDVAAPLRLLASYQYFSPALYLHTTPCALRRQIKGHGQGQGVMVMSHVRAMASHSHVKGQQQQAGGTRRNRTEQLTNARQRTNQNVWAPVSRPIVWAPVRRRVAHQITPQTRDCITVTPYKYTGNSYLDYWYVILLLRVSYRNFTHDLCSTVL